MEEKLTWTPEKRRERMIQHRDACLSRAEYWRSPHRVIMPEVGQTTEFMAAEAVKADALAVTFDDFAR